MASYNLTRTGFKSNKMKLRIQEIGKETIKFLCTYLGLSFKSDMNTHEPKINISLTRTPDFYNSRLKPSHRNNMFANRYP